MPSIFYIVNCPYNNIVTSEYSKPKKRGTRKKSRVMSEDEEKNVDNTVKEKVKAIKDDIAASKLFNFQVRPRLNLFSSNDKDEYIDVKEHGSRVEESMKWGMISIYSVMGANMLRKHFCDLFFKAVVVTKSYLNGFDRPVFTLKYFNKLWITFLHCVKHKPDRMSILFQPKYAAHQCKPYIDTILEAFPTHLYELNRYSTQILGISARTSAIIELMN